MSFKYPILPSKKIVQVLLELEFYKVEDFAKNNGNCDN